MVELHARREVYIATEDSWSCAPVASFTSSKEGTPSYKGSATSKPISSNNSNRTMSSLSSLLLVLLAVAVAASSAAGNGGKKLKHIRLYMHETFAGPNSTVATIVPSPLGANATFGSVAAFDDELRAGQNGSSELLARYQGIIVATGLAEGPASQGRMTVASVLFVAGEYNGSALSLEGPFVGFTGTIERSIVGGNGKFRMARGYYLFKLLDQPTPSSVVAQFDLYVLTCDPSYMM